MSAARAALVREVAEAIQAADPCACRHCSVNAARAAIRAVGEAAAKHHREYAVSMDVWLDPYRKGRLDARSASEAGEIAARRDTAYALAARIRDLTGAGDT